MDEDNTEFMVSISQIESDLTAAMKAKDQMTVETLRGLKVRLQNEKIAKMADLTDDQIVALLKSEIKRRKEAAESFSVGGRGEMAQKELAESEILQKYLPAQMSEAEISSVIENVIKDSNFTSADFGKAMGAVKLKVGNTADGAMVAKILKEKLK